MKYELEDYHGNISDEVLIADLKRVALGLKKESVTRAEYDNYGKFHSDTLRRRFGSWSMALEKTSLDFSKASKLLYPNRRRTSATNQELLEDLNNIAHKLKKNAIFRSEYKKHGKYGTSIFDHRFGSWLKALEKAGLNRTRNRGLTDEELLKDLKCIAIRLKKNSINTEEYKQYGKFILSTFYRRFGSWPMALEKAGLEKIRVYGITDKELFQNLEEVWIKLGRQPHYNDIIKPLSKCSKSVYISRFGTWRKTLKYFIEYINKEETPVVDGRPSLLKVTKFPRKVSNKQKCEQSKINVAIKKPIRIDRPRLDGHKTSRSVPDRLRYVILKRDKFKCQNCGRSPATDPTTILQIDHKTPYSKGGETVPENLHTLCSVCNVGKGDLE
jgi:5-methylcytosine-specific restriction endonuclease McrA